ncbi:MAG: electron transfer flavoprotein-ubiquinone oxidoreductase [Betaproteobacteria bacterium]
MQREAMAYDLVIVGGGPAGLAAAIRLKQLAAAAGREFSACLIEKGAEIGAHILSGAILDPRALTELCPDWQTTGAPVQTAVTDDRFYLLGESGGLSVPMPLMPKALGNDGNYLISLGKLCRWLAERAEALGVEIYPGFAGSEVLFDDQGAVKGVATGDMGRLPDGSEGPRFQPGMELHGRYTFFAEGCRGNLGKQLIAHFKLDANRDPQTYSLGIKEIWEVPKEIYQPGLTIHSVGWPLPLDTYGGGFLYHFEDGLAAVGLITGLGYRNPHLSPFDEFQRFKTHPNIRRFLEGGKRLEYGARALATGGLPAQPRLIFPGGALVGDDAGFLNGARIKGCHCALKSGMLAAEAAFEALSQERSGDELSAYPALFEQSWLHDELYRARNFKPMMAKGLVVGGALFGIDQKLFGGRAPWTLHNRESDHAKLAPADTCPPIAYPKPDGVLTFDRASSVYLSNTNHAEDQPCHLRLKDPSLPVAVNLPRYAAPEERYCPAGVYEMVETDGSPRLQINFQNCVHCKTCDIKDPTQNIEWVPPQGGEGPLYRAM